MKQYSPKEISVLHTHYPTSGVKGCQKYINRTRASILCKADSLDIGRENYDFSKKENFNEILSPKTPESAYLLGFLWGDGSLIWNEKVGHYKISLMISEEDFRDIAHIFKKFHVIYFTRNKKQKCASAYIGHKKLASFLKENDYLEKSIKTPQKILRLISLKYRHYFFRGWFDADGNNSGLPNGGFRICIAGSFGQDWFSLIELCNGLKLKYCIDRVSKINKQTKKLNKSSTFNIRGYDSSKRFCEFIFDKKKMGLSRKLNSFLNMKHTKIRRTLATIELDRIHRHINP